MSRTNTKVSHVPGALKKEFWSKHSRSSKLYDRCWYDKKTVRQSVRKALHNGDYGSLDNKDKIVPKGKGIWSW